MIQILKNKNNAEIQEKSVKKSSRRNRMKGVSFTSSKSTSSASYPETKEENHGCNFCDEISTKSIIRTYTCNASHKFSICNLCYDSCSKKFKISLKKTNVNIIRTKNNTVLYLRKCLMDKDYFDV